jgi:hypothetical protein
VHPPLGWLLRPSPARSQAPGQGCCLAQPKEIADEYCDGLHVSGLQRTRQQLTRLPHQLWAPPPSQTAQPGLVSDPQELLLLLEQRLSGHWRGIRPPAHLLALMEPLQSAQLWEPAWQLVRHCPKHWHGCHDLDPGLGLGQCRSWQPVLPGQDL